MHKRELEKAAYHEAGHAVVSYFFKIPFRYVTIDSKVPHLKMGGSLNPNWRTQKGWEEKLIIFVLAGPIGGMIYDRKIKKKKIKPMEFYNVFLSEILQHYKKKLTPDIKEKCLKIFNYWSMKTVIFFNNPKHIKSLVAIARELLHRKKMSYSEIQKIIED
jgi:hypothetical protein